MLRALFFLECDNCHQLYERLNTTVIGDPYEWAMHVVNLVDDGEGDGWCNNPKTYKQTCPSCVDYFMTKSNLQATVQNSQDAAPLLAQIWNNQFLLLSSDEVRLLLAVLKEYSPDFAKNLDCEHIGTLVSRLDAFTERYQSEHLQLDQTEAQIVCTALYQYSQRKGYELSQNTIFLIQKAYSYLLL